MKTLRVLAVATVLAVASAVPATAQEPGDSVVYEGDPFPVWVLVEDAEEAGAHRVAALVKWDDYRSILRFAVEVLPGELVVTIPQNAGVVSLETCAYTSALMAHGSEGLQPMERADSGCPRPPNGVSAVDRGGTPGLAAGLQGSRPDGQDRRSDDPGLRLLLGGEARRGLDYPGTKGRAPPARRLSHCCSSWD